MVDVNTIQSVLAKHGQEHLLAFKDSLTADQRESLLSQLSELDFGAMDELIQAYVKSEPKVEIPKEIAPPEILPAEPTDDKTRQMYGLARQFGEQLIREGKVAAFVVAGGQGTRLGYNGPKGCLGVTPIKHKSLFQVFAEQILSSSRHFGHAIPWYIMTSPANDAATRAFFAEHQYFGLPAQDVMFFVQGAMPAIGLDGKLLLDTPFSLALSPDGHGGSLIALARNGALADMNRRGVEFISYFQVDNPLVKCVDPLFIGLHALAGAEMSAKALPKREPLEKLGNFCVVDGRVTVIEYSDLPEALAYATEPDGRLRFRAGSIAIHILSRAFVERLTAGGRTLLPFHRAIKKVAHVNPAGQRVEPTEPNAVKLEMFVFDAMPLAAKAMILETSRAEEFSPVKNATGSDSLATSMYDQIRRAANWLKRAGAIIPRDAEGQVACALEISPLYALDAVELAQKLPPSLQVMPGQDLYLGE